MTNPELDPVRVAAADRVRDLTHALMAFEQDPEVLDDVVATIDGLLPSLQAGTRRDRSIADWAEDRARSVPPADGTSFPPHLDRPVSGPANPWSFPLTVIRRGEAVETTVTLRAAHEGAPGRSHGGVVSAIYDDLCGYILALRQTMAFTAWIKVDYHAGTPIGRPLVFRTWLDRAEGRKLFIAGDCHDGDQRITSCTALFVQPASMPTPPVAAPATIDGDH